MRKMRNLDRNVAMLCPLCGNDQFSLEDKEYQDLVDAPDNARLKCADCNSIYTKQEILSANAEKISIAAEEIAQDAMQDFEKELKKALGKWK